MKAPRWGALVVPALAAAACAACGGGSSERGAPAAAGTDTARPNIVVVVVDDLRWDELGAAGHPWIETPNIDRIAAEGAHFVNAFHAVSLCSPNRATLLTGQFPSQHGITDNVARPLLSHRLRTFPQALQQRGYRTAFIGKWHMGNDATPRPGFDYWAALPGQGRSTDPELYENGSLHVVRGYATDLLTDRAVEFIRQARSGPFLMYLAHKAIHPDITQRDDASVTKGEYVPAPRHRGRYDTRNWPARGNVPHRLGELNGMPVVRRALSWNLTGGPDAPDSTPSAPADEITIRRRAEMLLAVDESLGRILAALAERGELDRTVVVFTSDNGFFYGEHGLTSERRLPYEESIRNALLVRYPPLVRAGSRPRELALSTDIAPTLLELAGAPVGEHIQGRSLVPVLRGHAPGWRTSVLVEFYTHEQPFPHLMDTDYRALRTDRYKYIHWVRFPEQDELYDLESDSLELRNLAHEPFMASTRSRLRAELGQEVLGALRLRAGS